MKKILFLILCIILTTAIGCNNPETNSVSTRDIQIVVEPTDEMASTLNGYKNADEKSEVDNNYEASNNSYIIQYVGNKNSKKFHIFDCPSVAKTKDENKVYFNTSNEALSNGYSPCSNCNP